jgi:hypothetical protein
MSDERILILGGIQADHIRAVSEQYTSLEIFIFTIFKAGRFSKIKVHEVTRYKISQNSVGGTQISAAHHCIEGIIHALVRVRFTTFRIPRQ